MNISLFRFVAVTFGLVGCLLLGTACQKKDTSTPPPEAPVTEQPAVEIEPTNNEAAAEEAIAPLPGTVTPEEARNHVGKVVTVRGKVYRVHLSQKGDVFIDIGGRHPNAPFTAVCFQQAIPTDYLEGLNGQVISVRGKVKEYQGKVEIVLENANQLGK